MSITSKVPVGFKTVKFDSISDEYSYTLEQEPWYLLTMDPVKGTWVVQVWYQNAEASIGDSDMFEVREEAEDYVIAETNAGRWEADHLAKAFEIAIVVPEHVAKAILGQ